MAGEGEGYGGGYGGYNPNYNNYNNNNNNNNYYANNYGISSGNAAPVHVNEFAYGADDYIASAGSQSNPRSRGASNLSTGSGRSRGRSKQKYSENDDAASDIEEEDNAIGSQMMDDVPNTYQHNRAMPSVAGLDSTREIYKAEEENRGSRAPNQGLSFLCIIFGLIFVFTIVILLCYESNMMVVVGVFGDVSTERWNYGWEDSKIQTGDDGAYVDTYTSRIASDAGTMVLTGCLMSLIFCVIGWMLLCFRYSANLPLYSSICCVRIPHRATIYTILNTIELFTRRITIVYLILGIYGLIEMTYYVSQLNTYCISGECYAFIYPHYGWGILLVTTLMISLCGFTEARKLDTKLELSNLNLYWPEHAEYATSRNCPIDLQKLLKGLSNQRKILLNSIILYCLEQSGLLTTGVIGTFSDDSSGLDVDAALLQPHGWNLEKYYKPEVSNYDDNTEAKDWITWGLTFRDLFSATMAFSFINMIYLWAVLVRYSAYSFMKYVYIGINIILFLGWLGVTVMYYYTFYDYYFNGSGRDDLNTGPETADEYNRLWFPGWGIFVLILNIWYLGQCAKFGYDGL